MKSNKSLFLLCILFCLSIPFRGTAQELPTLTPTAFSQDSVQKVSMADFNRDNLLDLVLLSTSDNPVLSIHKNNGDDTFTEVVAYPVFENTQLGIQDFNLDNTPDIFAIGNASPDSVAVLLLSSDGELGFTKDSVATGLRELSSYTWLTYNDDQKPDLMISGLSSKTGEPANFMFIREQDSYTAYDTDFQGMLLSQISPVPGSENLYYIQTNTAAKPTGLYTLDSNTFEYIELNLPDLASSYLAQGDLNHDGAWDLFLHGENKNGNSEGGIYLRKDDDFEYLPLTLTGDIQYATIQDINNDGTAELLILLLTENGPTVYIASEENEFELTETNWQPEDLFISDYDKDGLPEFLTLNDGDLSILKIDTESENPEPVAPKLFISIPMEQGLLFSWSAGNDEKTPEEALSYELMISHTSSGEDTISRSSLINPQTLFDQHYGYGSLGTANIFHYQNVVEDSIRMILSTFDNAHHTGPASAILIGANASDICTNSPCLTTYEKDTLLCEPTANVNLNELFDYEAQYWVSYSQGIVNSFDQGYDLTEPELFYALNIQEDCIEILFARVEFEVIPPTVSILESCQGDSLALNGREGDYAYTWLNEEGDILGDEQLLTYVANESERIWVESTPSSGGCSIIDTFRIEVYPYPQLEVIESVSIRQGEQVTLYASGAEYYEWTPAESLQNADSPSPTASPQSSTTYYVKAWNEDGCITTDSVHVEIQKDFFVPSLFSPNGDGKNDRFAVIGSGLKDLRFRIFDQKGNLVWEANNPAEARMGWNGLYRGSPLPSGNYAWELQGNFEDGSPLHFENKRSGFITLIR